jgi:DNA repair exonuclease SbcCD ATPase subunit
MARHGDPDLRERLQSGWRQCGYSLCAQLFPDDLIPPTGGRPAEYHRDSRWRELGASGASCRDLGQAEAREAKLRTAVAERPEFADTVGPPIHRPDLDDLGGRLSALDDALDPARELRDVVERVDATLAATRATLEQDTHAALEREQRAVGAERAATHARGEAERAAARDRAAAQAAVARAETATRARAEAEASTEVAENKAQQIAAELRTLQGVASERTARIAELTAEKTAAEAARDTAVNRVEDLTGRLATTTTEREAARSERETVTADLARLTAKLDDVRRGHETALTDLDRRHREELETLRRDLGTTYQQELAVMRERHAAEAGRLGTRITELTAALGEERGARAEVDRQASDAVARATAAVGALTHLREGLLTALATPAEDLPDRLRTLLRGDGEDNGSDGGSAEIPP